MLSVPSNPLLSAKILDGATTLPPMVPVHDILLSLTSGRLGTSHHVLYSSAELLPP